MANAVNCSRIASGIVGAHRLAISDHYRPLGIPLPSNLLLKLQFIPLANSLTEDIPMTLEAKEKSGLRLGISRDNLRDGIVPFRLPGSCPCISECGSKRSECICSHTISPPHLCAIFRSRPCVFVLPGRVHPLLPIGNGCNSVWRNPNLY